LALTRRLLSFLPSNNLEAPPYRPELFSEALAADPELERLLPSDPAEAYDVRTIIARLVDGADFLEVQAHFAPNLVIGFARMLGRTVGLVANQPAVRAGVLDIDASDKAARFVRFCNIFNIPLVTLVDVPGFLPGTAQEYGGVIRHGAKMLFAYSAATVPKVTVVMRKAYGGAYLAMCGRDLGADFVVAWPGAEIAVMGAEGAVQVLYRKEIDTAPDRKAARAARLAEYRDAFANPYEAAARGLVHDVIEPGETRPVLGAALEMLRNKREIRPAKKHGNIPL
jgi:methylmalonyl-CoA carboxyltransferase large subunit